MIDERAGVSCARPERRDAQRNLERVLKAAYELFAERGVDDVRMEEVAQRAGVGVGTIYRRFRSKDELFAAVSDAACANARDTLEAAAHTAYDPVSKLRALVVVQYRRSAAFGIHTDERAGTTGMCGVFDQEQLYTSLHSMLAQVIAEGQHQGSIRQGDVTVLAALCLELLSPRAFQHITRVSPADPDDLADHVADFLLHALKV
jgi:AcrR family transcriptional regulator